MLISQNQIFMEIIFNIKFYISKYKIIYNFKFYFSQKEPT